MYASWHKVTRNKNKKFVPNLMEGKTVLLCLMVLVLLVNSTHAGTKLISLLLYMCFSFTSNCSKTSCHEYCRINYMNFFVHFQFGILWLMYVCCLQSIAKSAVTIASACFAWVSHVIPVASMCGTMSRKPTAAALFLIITVFASFANRVVLYHHANEWTMMSSNKIFLWLACKNLDHQVLVFCLIWFLWCVIIDLVA